MSIFLLFYGANCTPSPLWIKASQAPTSFNDREILEIFVELWLLAQFFWGRGGGGGKAIGHCFKTNSVVSVVLFVVFLEHCRSLLKNKTLLFLLSFSLCFWNIVSGQQHNRNTRDFCRTLAFGSIFWGRGGGQKAIGHCFKTNSVVSVVLFVVFLEHCRSLLKSKTLLFLLSFSLCFWNIVSGQQHFRGIV